MNDIPNSNCIQIALNCGLCLQEKPNNVSCQTWSRLDVGWTKLGLQVWCRRHGMNVCHIDFEGEKLPANCTATLSEEDDDD